MMDGDLFDWRAAGQPLLDAMPGTQLIATCGRCGQRIEGLAGLYDGGKVCHPGECPARRPPPGMLI